VEVTNARHLGDSVARELLLREQSQAIPPLAGGTDGVVEPEPDRPLGVLAVLGTGDEDRLVQVPGVGVEAGVIGALDPIDSPDGPAFPADRDGQVGSSGW